ncbi:hypothetical protein R6Q57_008526 [Mikania cordata]
MFQRNIGSTQRHLSNCALAPLIHQSLSKEKHFLNNEQSLPSNSPSSTPLRLTNFGITRVSSSDRVNYESLVNRYQYSCYNDDSKQLHLQIFKNGYTCDVFLLNILVTIYTRISEMQSARKVFDEMPLRNSISWSCLISGYTRNDMPNEACDVFREMIRGGFSPVHYAIGSVLRACQVLESHGLRFGMQLHGFILKSLNCFHEVVCNALISMYGNCMDSPDYAFCVFGEMKIRSLVSWNAIISVCSKKGDAVSAFKIFSGLQVEGLQPTEYTFGSIITAASRLSEINSFSLEQVMCTIQKSGFLFDLYVGSSLVSGFARSGQTSLAKRIFELMDVKNMVSMHGLMIGLARQKHAEEAVEVFLKMKSLLKLTSDSYVILLSTLSEFFDLEGGRKMGKEVHAYVIRNRLTDFNIAIENSLINMYAKCGSVKDASSVFKLMINKDEVSWNSVITGFDQNACFIDAVMMFCEMRRNQLKPGNFTVISALSSCAGLGSLRLGEQVHCECVKLGLDNDVSVSNSLLEFYSETGCINNCKKVFSLMQEHDQVSWNSIIGGFSDSDSDSLVLQSVEYFMKMMRGGWCPNSITFVNMLGAISSVKEGVRQIHGLLLKYCFADENAVGNAIIMCYGKCGNMDDCEKVFSKMGDQRDETSWNSMISGYIHNEQLNKAMALVKLMLTNGQRLDCFTLASVLSACASVATLERGFNHFNSMSEVYGLNPKMEHYSCMVDILGRAGEVDKMEDFLNKMPMSPSVLIWRTVLGACCRSNCERATDLGIRAGSYLLELDPNNAVNYVLLSNLYAVKGKWEDMRKTRILMKLAEVKKEAGCSWVTMKDGVHIFVASDKSHPEIDEIYKKVHELQGRMREMGYVPEIRYTLRDLEIENQEEILSYHSEKLAVGFVLTRKSELPIRIMKNLRVCGDCHTFLKYVSRIVGRLIVVRDSNRFHHFVNVQPQTLVMPKDDGIGSDNGIGVDIVVEVEITCFNSEVAICVGVGLTVLVRVVVVEDKKQ